MWVRALHARYGPVVRIAPDELSFTSPDSWRQIYGAAPGSRGGSITDKVEELYGTGLFPDTTTPINAELSDVEHARIRRTFAPAFTDKALREQEPLFDEHVGRLVEKIRTRVTAEEGLAKLDAVHWYKLCSKNPWPFPSSSA
jgi:cytochrome P450